jgi:phage portal protein BeeE
MTGITTRFKHAVSVFRHGYPMSIYRPPETVKARSFTLAWPTLVDVQPEWHLINYSTYVKEGVNANSVIYSAIAYKQRCIAAAPLRAYGGDVNHPEPLDAAHPLAKLVERPNPWQDWRTMQSQADAYLNVSGNAYFWLKRPERGEGLPESIWCPRPDRVFVVPAKQKPGEPPAILGYIYVPEGVPWGQGTPILPQNMMHVKLFNPGDELGGLGEGLSPLSPAAYPTDVDNMITKFINVFFQKGGVPPYWFTYDVPLDNSTVAELQQRIQEAYGGTKGWVKPGVLDRGGDVKRIGLTFEEMGFEVIDERNESRILGPLGVPGVLIGTRLGLQRAIRANAQELRRMFWEDTMMPELGLFGAEYRYYLRTDDGAFVAHDYGGVPALQRDVLQQVDAAYKMWQMGTPANTAYETVGLSVPDVPQGDMGYVPLGVMPVGSMAQSDHTEEGAAEAEDDTRKTLALVPSKKASAR